MAADDRWAFQNILPVAFMLWVVACTWSIHFSFHLLPTLQQSGASVKHTLSQWPPQGSSVQAIISQTLAALFFVSLGRAMFTDPGFLPKGTGKGTGSLTTLESKRTGEPRYCKWCKVHKPDRSHHCRACKACVLRMDHHCPWISNCVGFRNHKYFFLVVFYSLANCFFNMCTMHTSLSRFYEVESPALSRFMLVFGMTTSALMVCVLMPFLGFHIWLMLRATTTIEFCEKSTRYRGNHGEAGSSKFDRGCYENLKAVLGPVPLLWLLPISPPKGDGYSFAISLPENVIIGREVENTALIRSGGLGMGTVYSGCAKKDVAATPGGAGSPEVTGSRAAQV